MDYASQPAARRKVLGDATSRANEDVSQRRRADKHPAGDLGVSSMRPLPHNESLVPDGSLAVRNGNGSHKQPSSQPKRVSAVVTEAVRPHNPKRDSEISNASTTSNRKRQTHIGPWQLGKTIGEGGCSRVRIVRHSVTGEYGAAKIISRAMADKVRALSLANLIKCAETDPSLQLGADSNYIPFGLEREICIMKLLEHPNIVRLHDIWENRNELYLIMDYVAGGELLEYIGKRGILQEIEVVYFFRQIIAALAYCHRLYIHHRDLKPENILLDRTSMQIKLVDFGMAALQPLGTKLTTPCGSPHYAAPEVIKSESYDGAKADIWSCGVILFVMLTGSPPFNYSDEQADLGHLFRCIARAEYVMPEDLSPEAKDLIRRILVPNPRQRISIEEIWNHPLLHKYDEELGYQGEKSHLEHWVGSEPCIVGWKPLSRSTVDREILRYLRTLWHSTSEETLVQRLISPESNQEKYFYSVLVKYRDDQLEDYTPGIRAISYSTSDHHHHVQRPQNQDSEAPPLPESQHKRSRSAYSIMNNEHIYSKHSLYGVSSEASYDPFRASRDPLVAQAVNHNVTVHRGSVFSGCKFRPTTALGHRSAGSSLRAKAIKNNSNRHSSVASRRSSKYAPSSARSQRSVLSQRPSVSRSSMVSSHWASSPPIIVRPGGSRRGVSFTHLRRPSGTSVITGSTGGLHCTPGSLTNSARGSMSSTPRQMLQATPTPRDRPVVNRPAPRPATSPKVCRLRVRKPESPSKYIQSEARKVSSELEKVMDEAFNRNSITSSTRTPGTYPSKVYSDYTPPTSVANTRDSGASTLATPKGMQSRPLPPIPDETPKTFLHRKLTETREEIARRREQHGRNLEHFNEVLEHIDRLMLPAVSPRVCSAPAKSPEHPLSLPVISEENKMEVDGKYNVHGLARRAATDPLRPNLAVRPAVSDTIRLVEGSPSDKPAPLNIRKKSGASTASCSANSYRAGPRQARAQAHLHEDVQDLRHGSHAASDLADAPDKKEQIIKKKMSSWFRRNHDEKEKDRGWQVHAKGAIERFDIPERWQGLDDRVQRAQNSVISQQATSDPERSLSSEFPMRNCVPSMAGHLRERKSLLGFFGKKAKEERVKGPLEIRSEFSSPSILSGFDFAAENPSTSHGRPQDITQQSNWLYRFLNIKPATRLLCFQAGRGKVRQDIVRLLRDWQRFGVRDVTFERKTNTVTARVDKSNHLKIKPVSLVIELFVVLQHGRHAKLCLARMTQTKGAASSFGKVADIVEDVFRAKGMLVQDEFRRREMVDVFDR